MKGGSSEIYWSTFDGHNILYCRNFWLYLLKTIMYYYILVSYFEPSLDIWCLSNIPTVFVLLWVGLAMVQYTPTTIVVSTSPRTRLWYPSCSPCSWWWAVQELPDTSTPQRETPDSWTCSVLWGKSQVLCGVDPPSVLPAGSPTQCAVTPLDYLVLATAPQTAGIGGAMQGQLVLVALVCVACLNSLVVRHPGRTSHTSARMSPRPPACTAFARAKLLSPCLGKV